MSLKERLSLLVEKGGGGTRNELMVELIVQVERLGDILDRGIVVFDRRSPLLSGYNNYVISG